MTLHRAGLGSEPLPSARSCLLGFTHRRRQRETRSRRRKGRHALPVCLRPLPLAGLCPACFLPATPQNQFIPIKRLSTACACSVLQDRHHHISPCRRYLHRSNTDLRAQNPSLLRLLLWHQTHQHQPSAASSPRGWGSASRGCPLSSYLSSFQAQSEWWQLLSEIATYESSVFLCWLCQLPNKQRVRPN